jgi:acyl carrier protein
MSDKLADQVKDIIADKLGVDREKVKEEATFIGDLGADSLDMVELLMSLEDHFKIQIPDEEAEGIKSVGDSIAYIQKHAAMSE